MFRSRVIGYDLYVSEWTVIDGGPLWDKQSRIWVHIVKIIAVGVSQWEADRLTSVNPGSRHARPTQPEDKVTA